MAWDIRLYMDKYTQPETVSPVLAENYKFCEPDQPLCPNICVFKEGQTLLASDYPYSNNVMNLLLVDTLWRAQTYV